MAENNGLGRKIPPDFMHVDKYPLRALPLTERPKAVPVVIGINWHASFDRPRRHADGTWWIENASGGIRGGHAICMKPDSMTDIDAWWTFYDQGNTGECVGFSCSRMMTLLNRARFDAPWLYFKTQEISGQPRDPNSGTYVRGAGEVLRKYGHKTPVKTQPGMGNGISAYRWAQSIDEIRAVLASPAQDARQAFNLVNSWGKGYPHIVRLPYTVAEEVLFNQEGEAMVVTDR